VRARHATTPQHHHPALVLHFWTYEERRNMGKFNLTVDSFGITQTRSKHEDTNYIGLTLKLGSLAPTTMVQSLGNVNNGTHPVNLSISGFDFGQDDTLVFNYVMVNAGSTNIDEVRAALKAVGCAWASGGGPPAPHLASANGIDTDYLVAQLEGIFRSTCDGIVAAEQNQLVFGQLPISQQTPQPGTHSPSGCGNNSQYTVQWHIAGAVVMPEFMGPPQNVAQQVQSLKQAGMTHISETGAGVYVVSQTPNPGVYVDATTQITVTFGENPR
jgi:PASTA domain